MKPVEVGKIIDNEETGRDAIHVAVLSAVANKRLVPGQHVGFVDSNKSFMSPEAETLIGIVDPFLTKSVFPDERFWVFLYPNTITGLRHNWTHPIVDGDVAEEVDSEQWLREFAEEAALGYISMLGYIENYVKTGEHWTEFDSEIAIDAYSARDEDEFWHHVKNVTGMDKPSDGRDSPFSCSC